MARHLRSRSVGLSHSEGVSAAKSTAQWRIQSGPVQQEVAAEDPGISYLHGLHYDAVPPLRDPAF